MKRENTQALEWMRALQQEIRKVQRRLEDCMRQQLTGELSDEEFDDFTVQADRFGYGVGATVVGIVETAVTVA